jgi:hypothetical protein
MGGFLKTRLMKAFACIADARFLINDEIYFRKGTTAKEIANGEPGNSRARSEHAMSGYI